MKTVHGFTVKRIDRVNEREARGDQELWSISPPVKFYHRGKVCTADFVVVSAVVTFGSGPETYIFPSDRNGEVINWGELPGSQRGTMNHEATIMNVNHDNKEW
jgi:hypothetical protein